MLPVAYVDGVVVGVVPNVAAVLVVWAVVGPHHYLPSYSAFGRLMLALHMIRINI